MQKARYVYVVYINTTPEKLWAALGDPELTRQYWGRGRNVSDWKPGSPWRHENYDDAKDISVVGKVIESVPFRRLVLTWAYPADANDAAKASRVTFEIEPFMEAVKLTVIHDDLEPESKQHLSIMQGWPAVLSSLKSLLETGHPLSMTTRRWSNCR